jgi:hypothetical protein
VIKLMMYIKHKENNAVMAEDLAGRSSSTPCCNNEGHLECLLSALFL